MMGILKRMFNIHEGEGVKVFAFTLLTVLLNAGLGLGMSAADSLFLSNVGAAHLPVVYLGAPLVLLCYIPISVWLMGRIGKAGLFRVTLIVMAVGGAGVWAGSALPEGILPGQSLYYAAKIYTGVWYVALYSMLWSFIDSYFDILDAKRLFSLFAAGTSFGMMLGGAMVVGLVSFLGVEQLFLVWTAISLATLPVLAWICRRWRSLEVESFESEEENAGFIDQWRIVVSTARQSRFLWVFGTVLVATLVINTLCEFQYMRIFEEGRTEEEIASLFGRLYFGVNAFNLLMNLFLFNRLIAAVGVRNIALIQPVVYIATFSFFFINSGFGAAVAGFIAFHGIMASIEYNNQNLLFNALPERGKAEVRAIVEGIIEPMAIALAGLFLVLAASHISADAITVTGLVLALMTFCATLLLRAEYVTAMVSKLKDAWLNFAGDSNCTLELSDLDRSVLDQAVENGDLVPALTAFELLWRNGERQDALTKMVGLLHRIENDSRGLAKVMETLRQLAQSSEEQRLIAARLLKDWHSRSESSLSLREELERWEESDFSSEDELTKENLRTTALSRLNELPYDEREAAIRSLMQLLDGKSVEAVPPLIATVSSTTGSLRLTALAALELVSDPDCIPALLAISSQFSPSERRHVEGLLTTIGRRSVPTLVALLTESDSCHAGRSIGARALAVLAFPQLEALADQLLSREIERAYRYVCSESAVAENMPFLGRLYRDLRQESVDYVLEILSLTGKMADHEMIAASLRSPNLKERANAIETVEQGCERPVFRKLLPLIDGRPLERALSSIGSIPGEVSLYLTESVRSGGVLECVAAFHSLWGTAHQQSALDGITKRNLQFPGGNPLLTEIVSSALLQNAADSRSALPNTIEKIQILAECDFFSSLRMTEILDLALQAEVGCSTAGSVVYKAGDSCDALYVVMSGAVQRGTERLEKGELLGNECLAGTVEYQSTVVSQGASLMVVPQSAVWKAASIHPNTALALLALQTEEVKYVA